ncbi:MAG: threonine synthase [Burkholderiaceae bacterium]|jgi:threonine synthase|nr:threonine synthase [Burkholderiales bacterium]MCZ8102550.1 threonine synthase [Burkholderiales bacterium]MCZ8336612.1 threonine synthase [Burkholderiaceae bacterium]
MRYLSTRGGMPPQRFTDILLGGLAPDGGLVVPERYPAIDHATLEKWRALPYADLAFVLLRLYCDDIPDADLHALVRRTYTADTFGSDDIVPVRTLEPDLHLLRLSNGPTLAFKDVAMQLLGHLFEYVLAKEGRQLNILGATSGDTGSAAEYAMRGRRGIRVFMLSPAGRMSPFQTAQMFSLRDANIYNIAVDGVFDDCQDMVKAVSADLRFKARHAIGTVNSINWARVVAQVVYYFKAWFAVTAEGGPREVSFTVPSGNFGNVLAGHIARRMGLPIRRLVVATNENDVLDEFFRTGVYRPRGTADTHATSSPSMDISKASNFERFVWDLVGQDAGRTAALWREVDGRGFFDLGGTPEFERVAEFGFTSGASSHALRLQTIRDTEARYGTVVDTHTADGLAVAQRWREPGVPMVCLETALPAKFAETIREALGRDPERPAAYAGIEARAQRYARLPADVALLKRYIAERAPTVEPAAAAPAP